MKYLLLLLLALPLVSFAECDPDLSSGGECWTNCTTEDDITICDIIDLDALFPESNPGVNKTFQAKPQPRVFGNKFKTKKLQDGRTAKGHYVTRNNVSHFPQNGHSNAKNIQSNDKADLMATTMGFIIAGGVVQWGSQKTLVGQPSQTGVGSNQNLCRYTDAQFRPFNKGIIASGTFHINVKRDGANVHSSIHSLEAKSGIPVNSGYYQFALDLRQGWNEVQIKLDSNNKVDELDESNNDYKIKVFVDIPCGDSLKVKTRKSDNKEISISNSTYKANPNRSTKDISSNIRSNASLRKGGGYEKIDELKTPPGYPEDD